jgi:hypothetical protein
VLFATGFQELARTGQTVPPKMCTKAGYQEIFAEFVEGAKPSEAQWYSVKPLHTGIPSLVDLLEVSSENLQILLMKAGTGNLGKRDKLFSFQSSKFESFRSKYMLQDGCETTRRQVKGLKFKQWFVRLGTNYLGDLADPGVKGRAPRVQNIRSLRKTSTILFLGFLPSSKRRKQLINQHQQKKRRQLTVTRSISRTRTKVT